MLRETPLVEGETYHIFNRGAHKQDIFLRPADYDRFTLLLYVSNSSKKVHLGNLLEKHKGPSFMDVYTEEVVDKALVDIFAYALMPNHFHIVVRQKTDDGISLFMKKMATAYAMYFNAVNNHTGVVFQGRFQSRHIDSEAYHRWIFSYVHLNPVDLIESGWKENGIRDHEAIREFIENYRYSSYVDYCNTKRSERIILSDEAPAFLKKTRDLDEMLKWERKARALYL